MKKYENGFVEQLIKDGEYILEKESFKFRKAKVLECESILNSEYKDSVGKTFDVLYSYDYEEMICIQYNDEELWLKDWEYEFVDDLPEYIKDKKEILKLNRTKEFYGGLWLDYDFDGKYEIKNNCSLKVEYVLEDSKEYELATKEEYENELVEAINRRKDYIESKMSAYEKELKALEDLKK